MTLSVFICVLFFSFLFLCRFHSVWTFLPSTYNWLKPYENTFIIVSFKIDAFVEGKRQTCTFPSKYILDVNTASPPPFFPISDSRLDDPLHYSSPSLYRTSS